MTSSPGILNWHVICGETDWGLCTLHTILLQVIISRENTLKKDIVLRAGSRKNCWPPSCTTTGRGSLAGEDMLIAPSWSQEHMQEGTLLIRAGCVAVLLCLELAISVSIKLLQSMLLIELCIRKPRCYVPIFYNSTRIAFNHPPY